jgi:hypothetical protein
MDGKKGGKSRRRKERRMRMGVRKTGREEEVDGRKG